MGIKPIRTDVDHQAALVKIESLWDARPGTHEYDELEVLATLVDTYERTHVPIAPPDPVEAIKFRLEQAGLTRKALEPFIGTRARVAEILNRKRSLTLAMIRALHRGLGIPLESLVAERSVKSARATKRPRAA
ncbi:MAG TPA: helix-turn-helix domain-containing protein [Polyangiaceae bacterium]|nr:helix-turn-helix domain-containing protein [Polyangiaceae bacterium]